MFSFLSGLKSSRRSGWTEFLKVSYEKAKYDSSVNDLDLSQRRQAILANAKHIWSESTPDVKQQFTARAKRLNLEANLKRDRHLISFSASDADAASYAKDLKQRQVRLVNLAFTKGILCPESLSQQAPSMLRPKALAKYACQQRACPVEDAPSDQLSQTGQAVNASSLTENDFDLVQQVLHDGVGFHAWR